VRFEPLLVRDTTERGRTVASVNAQLAANVKPMHDRYVQPHAEAADFVTEHGDDIDQVTARLLAELTARAAAAAPARP
ncbi:MAG: uridine kinase, partial [Acidimicrobiia bacterium]|nr:uridine kinase [Acidimicrobiia bacterium]